MNSPGRQPTKAGPSMMSTNKYILSCVMASLFNPKQVRTGKPSGSSTGETQQHDFAISEEVTIWAQNKTRPDIVLYVNGIALGVLERKRSTFPSPKGSGKMRDSQKQLIRQIYSTIQFIAAGNDTQGLAYGAIDTKEIYYLHWKEVNEKRIRPTHTCWIIPSRSESKPRI